MLTKLYKSWLDKLVYVIITADVASNHIKYFKDTISSTVRYLLFTYIWLLSMLALTSNGDR